MADHKQKLALATAAWVQIMAVTQAYQAAVLRGASREELDMLRQQAHDLLDSNLDLNGEAAREALKLLER